MAPPHFPSRRSTSCSRTMYPYPELVCPALVRRLLRRLSCVAIVPPSWSWAVGSPIRVSVRLPGCERKPPTKQWRRRTKCRCLKALREIASPLRERKSFLRCCISATRFRAAENPPIPRKNLDNRYFSRVKTGINPPHSIRRPGWKTGFSSASRSPTLHFFRPPLTYGNFRQPELILQRY